MRYAELDKNKPYSPVLAVAFIEGEMELKLKNPGRNFGDSEIATASLANMLQVYGTLKAAHPDAAPIRVLDEYFRLDSEGKLLAHIEGVKASCPISGRIPFPLSFPRSIPVSGSPTARVKPSAYGTGKAKARSSPTSAPPARIAEPWRGA